MRQKIWSKNGMRQVINTGHKEFDRQTQVIDIGNVWANTQFSNYIRPRDEIECNGFVSPPGHLQNYDLGAYSAMPQHVESEVRKLVDTHHGGILYEFRHFRGKQKVIDGYILTDRQYHLLSRWPLSSKANQILDVCQQYMTE
jgi:hypothetical protein